MSGRRFDGAAARALAACSVVRSARTRRGGIVLLSQRWRADALPMHVLSSGHSDGIFDRSPENMSVGKRIRFLETSGLARGLYAVVSA